MYGKFLVEGDKQVRELVTSNFKIEAIYGLGEWAKQLKIERAPFIGVSPSELEKVSTVQSPNQVVAVAEIPQNAFDLKQPLPSGLYIICDQLNDPGNAGTIIRIADWFGLSGVFFSLNSVDVYNPKAVGAAKGSLFRMPVAYIDIAEVLRANPGLPAYGAYMEGKNIYELDLPHSAFIIIGNEANGISPELTEFIQQRVTIPLFGQAESLNAAVATGILVSEFKRR